MKHKVTQEQYEILMKAAKALDEQGVRSADEFGNCFYRGPSGTKCFIGHIISDEKYKKYMEARGSISLMNTFKGAIEGFEISEGRLLSVLQAYHDTACLWESHRKTNPNAMQDYVKRIVEVV